MKGYKRRQNHNGGRAQRIAANKERKRQERERLRKEGIEEAIEAFRLANKDPRAIFNWDGIDVPASFVKTVMGKYLKDNGKEI